MSTRSNNVESNRSTRDPHGTGLEDRMQAIFQESDSRARRKPGRRSRVRAANQYAIDMSLAGLTMAFERQVARIQRRLKGRTVRRREQPATDGIKYTELSDLTGQDVVTIRAAGGVRRIE